MPKRNEVSLMIRPGVGTNRLLLAIADEKREPSRARLSLSVDLPISGTELGTRIREMRESAGMNQKELAVKCGTTYKSISSVELNTQGRADSMSFLLLLRIAEVCGFELARVITQHWTSPGYRELWRRERPPELPEVPHA